MPCTHHISDPEVQPGQLDVVVVPGPDPLTNWDEIKDATDWLAAQAARPGTDILSICTGIYLCGAAGLLKGKKACGPRNLQGHLAKQFEGVQWVGEELRWVRDGNLWSSGELNFLEVLSLVMGNSPPSDRKLPARLIGTEGGVTNGNDLVSAYARLSGRIPGPVAEIALVMTDTGDRPQKYEAGQVATTVGIMWQILKAVFMGFGKKKAE